VAPPSHAGDGQRARGGGGRPEEGDRGRMASWPAWDGAWGHGQGLDAGERGGEGWVRAQVLRGGGCGWRAIGAAWAEGEQNGVGRGVGVGFFSLFTGLLLSWAIILVLG
jgi:hypothetical protein